MNLDTTQSLSFAKWFLHKHRHAGILVDNGDFDYLIAQLDLSSWNEFIATYDCCKSTADTLIPILVDNMPTDKPLKNTKRGKNFHDNTPKQPAKRGKKIGADSVAADPLPDSGAPIVIAKPLKQPAKRGKKIGADSVAEPAPIVIATDPLPDSGADIVIAKPLKQPTKRGKKIIADSVAEPAPIVIATDPLPESVDIVIAKPLKQPSKRGKKIVDDSVAESVDIVIAKPLKQPAKRGKKIGADSGADIPKQPSKRGKKIGADSGADSGVAKCEEGGAPDDIVVPPSDHSFLSEESYENDISLTEVFVNDTLFYTDKLGHWFYDSLLPVLDIPDFLSQIHFE